MHDTRVKMKDGRTYQAPIWGWRPTEGYFTLIDAENVNEGAPIRIELADVASAVTQGQRTHPGVVEDQDELARARRDGWAG